MKLQITEDGSHTLYSDMAGQTYHSCHGAITESNYIFINEGLSYWLKHSNLKHVRILEIGFGTALNDLLTISLSNKDDIFVDFSTVDLYPLEKDIYESLNYGSLLNMNNEFQLIHLSEWNEDYQNITGRFRLRKYKRDIIDLLSELSNNPNFLEYFDVVYFDAFSPDSQPDLWTEEVFEYIYKLSSDGAVLTTYCSKGAVRRCMDSVGFSVEKLAGPPGKRHILRAVK